MAMPLFSRGKLPTTAKSTEHKKAVQGGWLWAKPTEHKKTVQVGWLWAKPTEHKKAVQGGWLWAYLLVNVTREPLHVLVLGEICRPHTRQGQQQHHPAA